jgi:LmbE family N-acetylglucosaminyl deacetylase
MADRIARERGSGRRVLCVYLTDGSAYGVSAERRNQESRRALESLGVADVDIFFLGSEHGIADGLLVDCLDRALEHLSEWIDRKGDVRIDRVFSLAWEGGHVDHDAAYLVALAFAKQSGALDASSAFPAYNGEGTKGPLFRVMHPIAAPNARLRRRIGFLDGVKNALLCRYYRSQWRTWIGIFPEAFVKLVVMRREVALPLDVSRAFERPHEGPLFYERRFGMRFEEFMERTATFRRQFGSSSP